MTLQEAHEHREVDLDSVRVRYQQAFPRMPGDRRAGPYATRLGATQLGEVVVALQEGNDEKIELHEAAEVGATGAGETTGATGTAGFSHERIAQDAHSEEAVRAIWSMVSTSQRGVPAASPRRSRSASGPTRRNEGGWVSAPRPLPKIACTWESSLTSPSPATSAALISIVGFEWPLKSPPMPHRRDAAYHSSARRIRIMKSVPGVTWSES